VSQSLVRNAACATCGTISAKVIDRAAPAYLIVAQHRSSAVAFEAQRPYNAVEQQQYL